MIGVTPEWRAQVGDDLMGGYGKVLFLKKHSHEGTEMTGSKEWREGYTVGENERIALAQANSDLRSEVLKLADENNRLHHEVKMLEAQLYAPNIEYNPHHPPITPSPHRHGDRLVDL